LVHAERRAAVARDEVPVVALLAGSHDAVAAPGGRAIRVAAVAVDEVAVVTDLGRLYDAVTADGDGLSARGWNDEKDREHRRSESDRHGSSILRPAARGKPRKAAS